MEEGSWDLWKGTNSLLERLVNGTSTRLEGTGILELEEEEDTWKSGAPEGPGEVSFVLFCDFEEFKSPHAEAIKAELISRDDAAFEILSWGDPRQQLRPLPRYQLSGSIPTEQEVIPIRMKAVTIDDRALSPFHVVEGEIKARSKEAPVGSVTVGPLESISDLISCKMIVPNFVDEATVEDGRVRITLSEISPETTDTLDASESRGKVLPGSYLEVQRLQQDAGQSVELVVDDIG